MYVPQQNSVVRTQNLLLSGWAFSSTHDKLSFENKNLISNIDHNRCRLEINITLRHSTLLRDNLHQLLILFV